MLNIGRGWLVPVTMLNIGRGHRRKHPSQHCLLLIRGLYNFQLRMRTPKRKPKGVKWPSVTSGSHVTTVLLQRKNAGKSRSCAEHSYGEGHFRTKPLPVTWFCHFRSKWLHMRIIYFRTGHVTNVTSGHMTNATSGHMTSGHVTFGDHHYLNFL
jgi:hypothetical protein